MHELSHFFAVHLTLQAPRAQVCWQRFDSLLLHSKLHLPPVHVLSHSEASHFMLQGPLQSCVHSLEPVTDICDHYGFISTFHSGPVEEFDWVRGGEEGITSDTRSELGLGQWHINVAPG